MDSDVSTFQFEIQILCFFAYGPMTNVEINLIRVISTGIITVAISAAYCSFAYLLHGSLLKYTFLYFSASNPQPNLHS